MKTKRQDVNLLEEAKTYLNQLSDEKLRVAIEFLGYLQQKEEEEATKELLEIAGFEEELREAEEEAEVGEVVSFNSIRRDV